MLQNGFSFLEEKSFHIGHEGKIAKTIMHNYATVMPTLYAEGHRVFSGPSEITEGTIQL
jgi:hypothetical protein